MKCPVCGSSEIEEIIPKAPDYITAEVFKVIGCQGCDVNFTYPVPADVGAYYPSKYRGYNPFLLAVLRWFYLMRVKKWLKTVGGPGAALEVGCGLGLMLDILRRKGWEVTGIERTEEMAAKVRDNLGLNVISGDFTRLPKTHSFDLIVLFNVLEHMPNPQIVLKECAQRLKTGGFLIISVPNFDSWQARFNSHLWLHLDPPRHLVHFTPQSLENNLAMAGLAVHSVQFASFEHDPFGWIQSGINKIIGSQNNLTRYLMGIEHFNFRVGISIIFGLLMAIPAVFLSMASWVMKKGALMQVTAVLSDERRAG